MPKLGEIFKFSVIKIMDNNVYEYNLKRSQHKKTNY